MVDFLAAAGQQLVADAAGRTDRLRQLAVQRPVGLRREPRPGRAPSGWSPTVCCRAMPSARGRAEARLRAAFATAAAGAAPATSTASPSERADWLDDFALYRAIKRRTARCSGRAGRRRCAIATPTRWRGSRDARATRSPSRASCSGASLGDWRALRAYAHERGVALIGDLPIFVAHDSADVWQHRDQFHLDDDGRADAGGRRAARLLQRHRPALGQPALPLGRDARRPGSPGGSRASGRRWRCSTPSASITSSASSRYWAIPAREPTAVNGRWRRGPGARFFRRRRATRSASCRSSPRIWALVTPEVESLRDALRLPGDQAPAVRVRDRPAGAELPAAQLPARGGRLHRHARQRHHRRLVPRSRAAARAAPSRRRWSGRRALRYLGAPDVTTQATTEERSTGA